MPMDMKEALAMVASELEVATVMHAPFVNAHEGFAVLHEEFDELKVEVWKNPKKHPERLARIKQEAKQVAAMATRILVDLCDIACDVCGDNPYRRPFNGLSCPGCGMNRE